MNKKSMSEQDIRTNFITPNLQQAGWKGRRLREEVYFTDGKMILYRRLSVKSLFFEQEILYNRGVGSRE